MQYYKKVDDESIRCILCKHYCRLKRDKNGICGINYNIEGELVNKTYGHPSAINVDPIEKKPLYHFLPASTSLSIGTVGCNFRCPFCQNHSISQTSQVNEGVTIMPRRMVEIAQENFTQSISYTYNEPTIWYPYAKDIGVLAKEAGLKNVFVSSGYESHEVLADMVSWVDAANIDLKSFSRDYYKKVLKTDLDGVLESLKEFAKSPIWLEITTLIIPGVNDSKEELTKMAEFISGELGCDIPWHLSAFHPDYKMQDTPATPLSTLVMAKEIAKSFGMEYLYIGNVLNDNSTYCPKCQAKLVDRSGFSAQIVGLDGGACKGCGYRVAGVWQA